MALQRHAVLLALLLAATATSTPHYGGSSNSWDWPYDNNDDDDDDDWYNSNNPFNNAFSNNAFSTSRGLSILTAHAVLASLAFVLLFPLGGILIRLSSSPRSWLYHALLQLFALAVYTAAFGLGAYMATQLQNRSGMDMFSQAHVVIGIVLFVVVLGIQPVLGMMHHRGFKKTGGAGGRTGVSWGHLLLGRGAITLGMVNGGLGLLLARRTGVGRPSDGQVVAYAVVAGVMWLLYVAAAVVGEVRRGRERRRLAGKVRGVEVDEEEEETSVPRGGAVPAMAARDGGAAVGYGNVASATPAPPYERERSSTGSRSGRRSERSRGDGSSDSGLLYETSDRDVRRP